MNGMSLPKSIEREPGTMLTTGQAAVRLGLGMRTLEFWRANGGGPPFVRLGRLVKYRVVDLDAWLAERTVRRGR